MLKNGSFEMGWEDIIVGDVTRNQQPFNWELYWVAPGAKLYGSEDKAAAVPECVHKHRDQLPPHEHPGQPGALILDGEYVYKIFHSGEPFGAELGQVVRGLEPGSVALVSVPILLDAHGAVDPYGAEVCIRLGDSEQWVNAKDLGSRNWNRTNLEATVPASGEIPVHILFKSKWRNPVDFFIDHIKFDCTPASVEPDPTPEPPPDLGDDPIVITVIVPAGVEVEVERV